MTYFSSFERFYPQLSHMTLIGLKAIFIFSLGWFMASWISRISENLLDRTPIDQTIKKSFKKIITLTLKGIAIAITLNTIGVKLTIIAAMVGGFSIAIGLALKGNISNISDGITLLLNRQIKAGDFIEGSGFSGTVVRIDFFNTELTTSTNQRLIVPNSVIFNTAITNFSTLSTRRIDLIFGLSYSDDLEQASHIFTEVITSVEGVLKDPEVDVCLTNFGDFSINYSIRAWCNRADFLKVRHKVILALKSACDRHGFVIPFPQRDIHIKTVEKRS